MKIRIFMESCDVLWVIGVIKINDFVSNCEDIFARIGAAWQMPNSSPRAAAADHWLRSPQLAYVRNIELQKYNSTVNTILASYHLAGCASDMYHSSMIVLSSLILSYDWLYYYHTIYVNALFNFLKSSMILVLFPQDARKLATLVQNKVDALPEGFAEKDQEDVKDFRTSMDLTNTSK